MPENSVENVTRLQTLRRRDGSFIPGKGKNFFFSTAFIPALGSSGPPTISLVRGSVPRDKVAGA